LGRLIKREKRTEKMRDREVGTSRPSFRVEKGSWGADGTGGERAGKGGKFNSTGTAYPGKSWAKRHTRAANR